MTDMSIGEASLKAELERVRSNMRASAETIVKLQRRIVELEDGSCRFNCRTAEQMFVAGYVKRAQCDVNTPYFLGDELETKVGKAAYKDWRKRCSTKS